MGGLGGRRGLHSYILYHHNIYKPPLPLYAMNKYSIKMINEKDELINKLKIYNKDIFEENKKLFLLLNKKEEQHKKQLKEIQEELKEEVVKVFDDRKNWHSNLIKNRMKEKIKEIFKNHSRSLNAENLNDIRHDKGEGDMNPTESGSQSNEVRK